MLQINTGKLFTRDVGRTNNLRGVLYTNGWFGPEDLETKAGTLRSTDGERGSLAIVYELEERIEKEEEKPGVLISHTIGPYMRDFSLVASFGLQIIVSTDIDVVRRLTNSEVGFSSHKPPKEFVRRFFDPRVVPSPPEKKCFVQFVDDLLGLERQLFLAAMRAIRTYVAALHSIPDDLGLAYTLLVSAVETLVLDFDGHRASWFDIAEPKRRAIDAALGDASNEVATAVREAVIATEHSAMTRRYRDFILSKIDSSYYRTGDALIGRAVAKHQLPRALQQAYALRSSYIHSAKPLPDALTIPHAHWETTDVNRRPVLTIQGLSRLTRFVIHRFVAEGPKLDREEYDYNSERAGVVTMQLAPQYWVGHPLSDANHARRRLEGFLEQIALIEQGNENASVTDLRDMLKDVERLLPQAPRENKPALYALHTLFNGVAPQEFQSPSWHSFMERYSHIGDEPVGEILIARTFFDTTGQWKLDRHQEAFNHYWEWRVKKTGFHAPRFFEAAASLALAERYRQTGCEDRYRTLIAHAVECYPGHEGLLRLEEEFDHDKPVLWRNILIDESIGERK